MNKISNTHDLVYPFAQMSRKEHAHAQEDLRCHVDCRRTLLSPSIDRQGEGRRAKKTSCPNPAEGRGQPRGRRLEGPADRRGLRCGPRHRGTGAPALRRARFGGGSDPQTARKPHPPQNRRKGGSPSDRHGLRQASRGPQTLDAPAFGRPAGRVGNGRCRLVRNRAPDIKKTKSSRG